MRPLSNDLRRRIIEAIQQNEESQSAIAERFLVNLSTVEKLWRQFRETGSYLPKPHAGGRQRALAAHEELIRAAVAEQPDITLAELADQIALATGRPKVSSMTVCTALRRLRLPRKKS